MTTHSTAEAYGPTCVLLLPIWKKFQKLNMFPVEEKFTEVIRIFLELESYCK